jgi:uncharacterized protein YcgI (DUF1989 family)
MLKEVTEGALMLCLIAVALTLARTDVCLTACSSEKRTELTFTGSECQ